jgi:uncharacterized protein (TIGR03435 family)
MISGVFAQVHEVKVGEPVPNLNFSNTYNIKAGTIKLNDFRGKLIILDFWGPYCAPCIGAFRYLDSLQKEFNNQIQILPVSALSFQEVQKFFKTHIHVFKPDLPFITNAKYLDSLFPHTGVPFQVWISSSGKLLLNGNPEDLTRENLKKTLNSGKATYRKASKNVYASFIDERYKSLVLYASTICRYKSDSLRMQPELNSNTKHLFERGPIPFLYQRAFSDSLYKDLDVYSPGRVVLEVGNIDKFVKKPNLRGEDAAKWRDENCYNYQLFEPNDFRGDLYKKMKDDLDNYFQLNSRVEKRMVEIYALISEGNNDELKSKGGKSFNNFHKMTDAHSTETESLRNLRNEPFSNFTMILRDFVEYNLKAPFFDETGINYNVDLKINGTVLDDMDFNEWQEALKKYNLALVKKSKLIDVLVISDQK